MMLTVSAVLALPDPRSSLPPRSYTGQFAQNAVSPISLTPIGWIESPVREPRSSTSHITKLLTIHLTVERSAPPCAPARSTRNALGHPARRQSVNKSLVVRRGRVKWCSRRAWGSSAAWRVLRALNSAGSFPICTSTPAGKRSSGRLVVIVSDASGCSRREHHTVRRSCPCRLHLPSHPSTPSLLTKPANMHPRLQDRPRLRSRRFGL